MVNFIQKLLGNPVGRPALCLALYGPRNESLDLQTGLDWILERAIRLGLPEAEWVTLNYGERGHEDYKAYKLHAWKKRGRPLPSPICTSIQTGRFLDGSKQDMTDDIWVSNLMTSSGFVLCVDLSVADLRDDELVEMVADIQTVAKLDYGYVFRMPMEMSPPTYERGLLYGRSSDRHLSLIQENEISKWGNARVSLRDMSEDTISNYLRDIYPLNFLNPRHLAMRVKGQTLKTWIEAAPRRGSIKPLIEGKLWVWQVPDKRIQAIRRVLGPERLLITWGDFSTPSGGPLGHIYRTQSDKKQALPVFNGLPLTADETRWIADGMTSMKPIFERYTAEKPKSFDRLLKSRGAQFGKLLDMAFTAWSEDQRPDKVSPEVAMQAFAAALGEHLVEHYGMAWYAVENEYGRSLGVAHRAKNGAQTWSYPVDTIAKRIDRGETGFISGVIEAVSNEIERG